MAVLRAVGLPLAVFIGNGYNRLSIWQQIINHGHGRVQLAAWIISQIQHQTFHSLGSQLIQTCLKLVRRHRVKL